MKILIIRMSPDRLDVNSYNVQEIGLAHALRGKGHECDIVFYNGLLENRVQTLEDGTRIYWQKALGILKNSLFFGLWKICKNYDVLQVHEYDQLQSWLYYSFKRKPVVIYHGPYHSDFTKGYNKKCRIFDRIFFPFSGYGRKNVRCIGKSPLAADFLMDKGFEHVYSIGVGLNPLMLDSSTEADNRISGEMPDGKINIIYVGKLEDRRNSGFLLELMDSIFEDKDCIDGLHFTIVGKSEDGYYDSIRPLIEKLSEKGALSYYEKASQKELSNVYKKADIMLFPSRYEIFGMVLMEAMYKGCVCISSRNGGSSTVISDNENGIIIDDFDIEKWKKAVYELLGNNEKLESMSSNASRAVKEHFLWDKLADSFIAVYDEAERSLKDR